MTIFASRPSISTPITFGGPSRPGRKTYRRHRRKSSRSRADCGTDHKKRAIPIVEFGHGTQDVRTVRGRGAGGWVLPAPFVPATRNAEPRDQPRTPVPEYEGVDRELSCVRHIRHEPRGALGRRIPITGFGVAEARCRPHRSAGCPPGTPTEQCRGAGRRATRRADRIGAGGAATIDHPGCPSCRQHRAGSSGGPRRAGVGTSGGAASALRGLVRRAASGVVSTRPAGAASGVVSARPAGGPGGPVSSPYACGRRRVAPAVPGRPSPADAGGDRHVGARVVRAGRAASHRRSGGWRRSGRPAGTTAWTRRASAPDPDGPDTRKGRPGCPGRPCGPRQRLRDPAPPRSCRPPAAP